MIDLASSGGCAIRAEEGGPIRVAHVMGKMLGGGVESVVMNYYRHIDREQVQFDLLVDADSTLVPREEVESLGGRVLVVPPYQKLPRYMHELERLFRQERWPIVHSHVNALSVFPLRAAKRAGVPVRIAHSHSTAGGRDPLKNAMKAALRPFASVYPTQRVACTCHAGEWLFGKGADFRVVPNAIDIGAFHFDGARRARARAELGVGDGQLVVGHIGRFAPEKNQGTLIRAFSLVAKSDSNARLVLVGEGRQRAKWEALAARICPEGSVLFLGQCADVADLYCAFDVFCLPSEFEGLGMVAVEAEASGCPCVLSAAVPKEADPAGNAVFLLPNDVASWSEAILAAASARMRTDPSDFADYNIVLAAKELTSWYLSLFDAGGRRWT